MNYQKALEAYKAHRRPKPKSYSFGITAIIAMCLAIAFVSAGSNVLFAFATIIGICFMCLAMWQATVEAQIEIILENNFREMVEKRAGDLCVWLLVYEGKRFDEAMREIYGDEK